MIFIEFFFLDRTIQFTEAQNKLLSMHADVKPYVILVLLLRLRQLCCHPWLISVMLDREDIVEAGASQIDDENLDLMSAIEEIGIDRRVTEHLLTRGNSVFDQKRQSSKVMDSFVHSSLFMYFFHNERITFPIASAQISGQEVYKLK